RTHAVWWGVAAAAFVGLIATFSMHLVNLRMQNIGISASLISWSVAVQALAICLTALAATPLVARTGLRYTMPASSLLCGAALVAIFYSSDIYVINGLRALFAIGLTFLVVASEYLVTARCEEGNRGSVIAWYTTAIGTGTIIGPFLVSVVGIDGSGSFFLGAAMLLFGAARLPFGERRQDRPAHAPVCRVQLHAGRFCRSLHLRHGGQRRPVAAADLRRLERL